MRVGLALPHYDTSNAGRDAGWEGLAEIARLAESSGFDSVWVSDHLFLDWSKYGGPGDPVGSLECWTTLSAVAGVTERVRLGSLALCNDLRNPALLANMAASLDRISGGRLDIGLGAGWYEPEYRAAGVPFDPPGVRIRRAGEAAHIIGRMLQGETVTYSGRHYEVRGAVCRPLGVQDPRPPIWMGGKGDLLLGTAARHADGWNYSWLGPIESYRERAAAADRICESVGRDPRSLRRSVGAYVIAGRTESDARSRYDRLVGRTPAGVLRDGAAGAAVSWDEFRQSRVAGTVDEVTDRLASLAGLGVEEVVVTTGTLPFQVADASDVELVGTEIASALRRVGS